MRKLFVLFLVISTLGLAARAESDEDSAPETAPATAPAEPGTRVTRIRQNSSEFHRLDKRFQVTGEIGFPSFPFPAAGVSGAIFLNRNSLLDVDYVRANDTWLGYKAEVVMTGVHFQQFLTNSFYIKGGVDYRMIRLYDYWDILFGGTTTGEFARHDSIGPSFAVGNQWQSEHFVIGCDWGGVYIPAAILKNEYHSDRLSSSDRTDADDAWDRASGASIMAVRLHIGVSW